MSLRLALVRYHSGLVKWWLLMWKPLLKVQANVKLVRRHPPPASFIASMQNCASVSSQGQFAPPIESRGKRMFRRLKKFRARKLNAKPLQCNQQHMPSIQQFTFESLWDAYELRTSHYDCAKSTLGASNPRLLNWIGSIDHSGYTREKCLRALIANAEPGDENRILLRLQDWVPQVQRIARDWVLSHFRTLPMEAIRANQRLILYLSRKDRIQNDAGLREIKRDLLERTREMTPNQFFGLTAMFRKFLFLLSLEGDRHLRPWILDDPEPFNRLLLLTQFRFSDITPNENLRLQADKSLFVRSRLLYCQMSAGVKPERDWLISLAFDPRRSLRELGQYYLKTLYGEDCYSIYRSSEGEAFYLIADYARPEDAEHFLEGIRSGSRHTQKACVRALVRAVPDRLKDLDIASLISSNRRLRAILVPVLPRVLSVDEIMALRPAFEAGSPFGTVTFLRVLEKKSFWHFVNEGLSLLISDPETGLRSSIVRPIQARAAIYERLQLHLRESIGIKITMLRDRGRKQDQALINLIEFTLRTA